MKIQAVLLFSLLTVIVVVDAKCRGMRCGKVCCQSGERCLVKKGGVMHSYGGTEYGSSAYGRSSYHKSSHEIKKYKKSKPYYTYECVDANAMCGTEICKQGERCVQTDNYCAYEPCPSKFQCLNSLKLCGGMVCPADLLCFDVEISCSSESCPHRFMCLQQGLCFGGTCPIGTHRCTLSITYGASFSYSFDCVENDNKCGNIDCEIGKRCVVKSIPCGGFMCSTFECVDNENMCGDTECSSKFKCAINEDTCLTAYSSPPFKCLRYKLCAKDKYYK